MTDSKVVPFSSGFPTPDKKHADVVSALESILEQAKRGEITDFIFASFKPNTAPGCDFTGSYIKCAALLTYMSLSFYKAWGEHNESL